MGNPPEIESLSDLRGLNSAYLLVYRTARLCFLRTTVLLKCSLF